MPKSAQEIKQRVLTCNWALEKVTISSLKPLGISTNIADDAGRNFCTVGLTLLMALRLTLIAAMDPPDITVNFSEKNCRLGSVATVFTGNFALFC